MSAADESAVNVSAADESAANVSAADESAKNFGGRCFGGLVRQSAADPGGSAADKCPPPIEPTFAYLANKFGFE